MNRIFLELTVKRLGFSHEHDKKLVIWSFSVFVTRKTCLIYAVLSLNESLAELQRYDFFS